jgi:hypothetical protein
VGGACENHQCMPSALFCGGNALRQCAEDGLSSMEVESCGAGKYCDTDSVTCKVGVCEPNLPACDGIRATLCDDKGAAYLPGGTVCSTGTSCDAGECKPHVCTPSQGFCQGQEAKRCADNGLSSTVEDTCTANTTCLVAGNDATCGGDCGPGQKKCSGNGLQSCGANGLYDATVAPCAADKTCVGPNGSASCTGECGPGQKKCSGNGVQSCGATGAYGSAAACATNRTCVGGACVGVCGPGQSQSCGNCNAGTQTCDAAGAWGTCTNNPGPPTTYYRDGDGDGYGWAGTTTVTCTGAPAGYVANNTDCCDTDADARPGQTAYFPKTRTGHGSASCSGGNAADFNCDGVWSTSYPIGSCSYADDGSCASATPSYGFYPPTCGASVRQVTGCQTGCEEVGCYCNYLFGSPVGTQTCL